jgi:tetratricopeptide (TPR) repeat protein
MGSHLTASPTVRKYLERYAEPEARAILGRDWSGARFGHVVVIPSLGEGDRLSATFRSIPASPGGRLVVVVVNARASAPASHHEANAETLRALGAPAADALVPIRADGWLDHAAPADRLLLLNRAVSGRFLPEKQGVGLARECKDLFEESVVLSTLGKLHYGMGRYDQALEAYAGCLELTGRDGNRAREVTATGNMGAVLHAQGRNAEARPYFERSLALSREIGDSLGEAVAVGHMGVILSMLGEYEAARDQYEQHRLLARKLGYRQGEAVATLNLGETCTMLGRSAEALLHLEHALRLMHDVQFRLRETTATHALGQTLLCLGDYEAARTRFEEALALCREIDNPREEGDARLGLAGVAAALGDSATAHRIYLDLLALSRQLRDREREAGLLLAFSALRTQMGMPEEADSLLLESRELAATIDSPGVLVLATLRRAAATRSEVEGALDLFASCEARLHYVDRMEAHFLLWQATGDRTYLDQAARLLEEFRARAPVLYQTSMLEQVPLYHDIRAAAAAP